MQLGISLSSSRLTGVGEGSSLLAAMNDYWLGTSLADGTPATWDNEIASRSAATMGVGPTNTKPSVSSGLITADGTDDGIDLPSNSQPGLDVGTDTLTIGLLLKPTNTTQAFKRWYSAESAANNGLYIGTWVDGLETAARIGDGTTSKTAYAAGDTTQNRVTLVCCQVSTTHISVYTDDLGFGTPVALSGLTGDLTKTGGPRLFQAQFGGAFAAGGLGAVFRTTDLLTEAQLDAIAVHLRAMF